MIVNIKKNFIIELLNKGILLPLIFLTIIIGISCYHNTFEEYDGVMQFFAGEEIFHGQGYTGWASHFWPPLYSTLIGFLSNFTSGFFAGKIIAFTSAIIILYLVFLISLQLFDDKKIGLLAQIFLMINPLFFISAMQVENNLLDAMFFIFAIFLFFKAIDQPKYSNFFITGIIIGLAGLTRYTSFILIPALILTLLIKFENKLTIQFASIILIGVGLISAPWFYYNAIINGNPFDTLQYLNIGYGVFGDDKWWWSTQSNFTNVMDIIAYNPSKYFNHFLNNVVVSIIELIIGMGILAPIAVIAIPASFYFLKSQHKIALIIIFSLFLLGICQAFVLPESFLVCVFILTIVTVFILIEATKNLSKSNYKTIFFILIFLMGSIYCSIKVSDYLNGQSSDGGQLDESKQIAKFLIGYDSEISNKYIMGVHPARSYYAHAKYLMIPLYYEGDLSGLVCYNGIHDRVKYSIPKYPSLDADPNLHADYLIYDKSAQSALPQFSYLFDENSTEIPKNFVLIYKSQSVVVYKINHME